MMYFSVIKHIGFIIRGVITAKIKFGILLCFLPMQFLMFSLVFLMLDGVVFFVVSVFDYSFQICLCPYGDAKLRCSTAMVWRE